MARMPFHKPNVQGPGDAGGEQTEILNSDRRSEWIWGLPVDHMGLKLPLYIRHCGNSNWDPGVRITRKNSFIFGLELVVAGTLECRQNANSYLVEPGQVFILHPGRDHSYATGPGGRLLKRFVCIDGPVPVLQSLLNETGLNEIDVLRLNDVRGFIKLFKSAALLFETRSPGFVERLSELAYAMLLFLGNQLTGPRYPAGIQAALDYLQHHLHRSVSLEELARAGHLSVPYFCRLFRRTMGLPPMVFFRRQRIGYARQMLGSTTARINEIAGRLGFEDALYFSRVFTKETGLSPREYRMRQRS